MTFQQPFKIKNLKFSKPSHFDYAILSYWNDQFGPTPRNVWIAENFEDPQNDASDFTKKVNIIIQLILKSEVERNASSSTVDRHIYRLANQNVCVLAYMFSGRSRAIRGYSNCCLCFVLPSCHDDMFHGVIPLYDSLISFYLRSYRVILYKDFELGRTVNSDGHMDELMLEVDKLSAALLKEHGGRNHGSVNAAQSNCCWKINSNVVPLSETYMGSSGSKVDSAKWSRRIKRLKRSVLGFLSSFNRIVIVGTTRNRTRILKWCHTLSLLLPPNKRGLCFVEQPVEKLIPNALIQAFIHDKPTLDNSHFMEFLYRSDYPAVYFNPGKDQLMVTPLLAFHHHRYNFVKEWLEEHFCDAKPKLADEILDRMGVRDDLVKMTAAEDKGHNSMVDRFVEEISMLPDHEEIRMSHLSNFLTQLHVRANCMIQYIQQHSKDNRYLQQAKAVEGQFLCSSAADFQDFRMVLSIAETLHSGMYEKIKLGDTMQQRLETFVGQINS